jgi:hypothetical protein
MITEHRLLLAIFKVMEHHIDRPVGPDDFPTDSEASRCLRNLLAVKCSWPYRCSGSPGPAHFVFENGLYSRPEIHWPSPLRPDVSHQIIFRELESCFASEGDVLQAEKMLRDLFSRMCAALE